MKKPTITYEQDGSISIKANIKFEGDMLAMEEQIQEVVNQIGLKATLEALSTLDTNGNPIEVKKRKMTSKGRIKKK